MHLRQWLRLWSGCSGEDDLLESRIFAIFVLDIAELVVVQVPSKLHTIVFQDPLGFLLLDYLVENPLNLGIGILSQPHHDGDVKRQDLPLSKENSKAVSGYSR